MPDDGQVADEVRESVGGLVERGSAPDLIVFNAGQLLNEWRDLAPRVDEGLVAVQDFAAAEPDGAKFDDGIRVCVESGSFQVKAYELLLEGVEPRLAENGWLRHCGLLAQSRSENTPELRGE